MSKDDLNGLIIETLARLTRPNERQRAWCSGHYKTASDDHLLATGHYLTFGCCAEERPGAGN